MNVRGIQNWGGVFGGELVERRARRLIPERDNSKRVNSLLQWSLGKEKEGKKIRRINKT